MKILVIEDDRITSIIMNEILSAFGEVHRAENGFIGIEKFEDALINKNPFNLIFLDIMMPEMSGQEVLKRIRGIERQRGILGLDSVKICMTTALDDFNNIQIAFKNQCEAYLVKPLDKDKIVKMLLEIGLLN